MVSCRSNVERHLSTSNRVTVLLHDLPVGQMHFASTVHQDGGISPCIVAAIHRQAPSRCGRNCRRSCCTHHVSRHRRSTASSQRGRWCRSNSATKARCSNLCCILLLRIRTIIRKVTPATAGIASPTLIYCSLVLVVIALLAFALVVPKSSPTYYYCPSGAGRPSLSCHLFLWRQSQRRPSVSVLPRMLAGPGRPTRLSSPGHSSR